MPLLGLKMPPLGEAKGGGHRPHFEAKGVKKPGCGPLSSKTEITSEAGLLKGF